MCQCITAWSILTDTGRHTWVDGRWETFSGKAKNLTQNVSTLALLTFGPHNSLLCSICPAHCRVFSSIPGLYPFGVSSSPYPNCDSPKFYYTLLNVCECVRRCGQNHSIEKHCSRQNLANEANAFGSRWNWGSRE